MVELRHERRDVGVVIASVLLAAFVGLVSFRRAANMSYDFHHFYIDARHVWELGSLNTKHEQALTPEGPQLLFYLPAVPLMLAPMTALGVTGAAAAWAAILAISAGASAMMLMRIGRERGATTRAMTATAVLLLPVIHEAARFNQLSLPILAMALAALRSLEKGRSARCGAWIGVATTLKLLPALLIAWLLLKRRWAAAAASAATVAALAVLPCAAVFGWQRTATYHREWFERNVLGRPAEGMISAADANEAESQARGHFLDHRNQSLRAVLARVFQTDARFRVAWQPFELSQGACTFIERLTLAVLGLGIVSASRRCWNHTGPISRSTEFSAFLIAMQVFSPLVRQYYLVWSAPAIVALACLACRRSRSGRRLGRAGLVIWVAGMLAWISPEARAYGAHWLMLLMIGVVLLAASKSDANEEAVQVKRVERAVAIDVAGTG